MANQKTVLLSFSRFKNGVTNQLSISNVADVAANRISLIISNFFYLLQLQPEKNDIIVSELLADPDPVIGLPPAEFIEIYNRSSNPFDLNGWKLTDGSSTATFSAQLILPNQYWIVTSSANAALFSSYQNVIGVSNFPSLNNSGDLVLLKASSGLTVDSLNYSLSWYRDADKQQGGWSLERIDLTKTSTDPINWVASQDVTGGTPGKQNSWFGKNPDVSPPKLVSLIVKSDSQLELTFDEPLDQNSIVNSNFLVDNGIGIPSSAQLMANQKTVLLSFSRFKNGVTNQLSISNVADVAANRISLIISNFFYLLQLQPEKNDIIVSELLADPDPVIGLPPAEFIEIYNRSSNPFDLNGWKLTDGSSTATFSAQLILPNQYWIVTSSANAALFSSYQNVIGVSNFPSLNNSGDLVLLKASSGLTVDSLNYSLSWYRDADKQQGGWSLERIDLTKTSTDPINWVASQDVTGGTPGKQNSWFGKNPDVSPPKLITLIVKSDSQLELTFDEPLDQNSIVNSNFLVDNGIGTPSSAQLMANQKTVLLSFSRFKNGVTNQLSISNVADVAANRISLIISNFFYLLQLQPEKNDIIVSELLADPDPVIGLPPAEFIEIYNRSSNPFDLNGWKLTDGSSTATFSAQLILPNQYWIVTSSANAALFSSYQNVIGVSNFPSLNNSGDLVLLKASSGLTVDSLNYSLSWYRDADKQQGGWSLERIDLTKTSTDPINWVASQDVTGGTPGKQNSWFGKNPDVSPPKLVSLIVKSDSQLELTFDEPLLQSSFNATNFSISNSIGTPTNAQLLPDQKSVSLSFNSKFPNGVENIISIVNISDLAGNITVTISESFTFISYSPSLNKDVILTEILADPTPSLGLPDAEFIELYNRSKAPFNLVNWSFQAGTSSTTFINQVILPKQYLIVTNAKNVGKLSPFGKVLGLSSFPVLPNGGTSLILRNDKGQLIDSLKYSTAWYRNSDKSEGGYSLELIDPTNPCGEEDNWIASESTTGGTPGKQNASFANKPDLTGPKLTAVQAIGNNELILIFDEKLDFISLLKGNIETNPQLEIVNLRFLDNSKRQIVVVFAKGFEKRTLYSVTLKKVYDCAGNLIQDVFRKLSFAIPEEVGAKDVLINELLFNPMPNGVDFVEVYNNSSKFISLSELKLANLEDGLVKNIETLSSSAPIIEPNQFVVFTVDPTVLKNNYPLGDEKNFVKTNLPSLPDDEGSIALISSSGLVIDSFLYSKKLHSTLIKEEEGVSLERISLVQKTNLSSNWKSASSQSGFATPGFANSNARPELNLLDEKVTVEPEVFAPNSGSQDYAKINYTFDQNNFVANIKILDQQGRLVKTIANNETLGYSGFFRWDGNLEDGTKARVGYYIVWIDLFDDTGAVNTLRKRVIVAGL